MKKNYLIAVAMLAVCFALLITAIVFTILEKETLSTYFGMASCGTAFLSSLFGLNSWKEK